jgi:putative peptide zinc metalloprotease protein
VFDRHQKRVRREVGGYLMNFLFARIPLIDPQNILKAWVGVFGWLFGPIGIFLWLIVVGAGGYSLVSNFEEFWAGADPQTLLDTENLMWLYLCFTVIKVFHEFGHGFCCVYFGRKSGIDTPVHTMGIMLLLFMPVPYVDASSSWLLRSKWQRAFVGAAGMYVELAVASAAAVIWAYFSGNNPLVNSLAYNVVLIASISTLLFNGNPLLRFDGYYILSDLLEIANLAQRSRQYFFYLIRKYAYGVKRIPNPAHGRSEKFWLAVYAVAAMIYRVFICIGILLYVANIFFFIGVMMALAAFIQWAVAPLAKATKYLLTNPELARVRPRAIIVTLAFLGSLLGFLGGYPMPDRGRAEGVVEPVNVTAVHMPVDGFVKKILPTGSAVSPEGAPLLRAENIDLETEYAQLKSRLNAAYLRRAQALSTDPAQVIAITEQIDALRSRLTRIEADREELTMHSEFEGVWVSDDAERMSGVYLKRGQSIGLLADTRDLIIRVVADQDLGPRLKDALRPEGATAPNAIDPDRVKVEMRVKGRPLVHSHGLIKKAFDTGQTQLPSAALGYVAGGSMSVSMEDPEGTRTQESFFEFHVVSTPPPPEEAEANRGALKVSDLVDPDDAEPFALRVGQRVVVRFEMAPKPLFVQWWRAARQLVQRRLSLPG